MAFLKLQECEQLCAQNTYGVTKFAQSKGVQKWISPFTGAIVGIGGPATTMAFPPKQDLQHPEASQAEYCHFYELSPLKMGLYISKTPKKLGKEEKQEPK